MLTVLREIFDVLRIAAGFIAGLTLWGPAGGFLGAFLVFVVLEWLRRAERKHRS